MELKRLSIEVVEYLVVGVMLCLFAVVIALHRQEVCVVVVVVLLFVVVPVAVVTALLLGHLRIC